METEKLLKQYHPLLLTRSEVKEIFRLSERQLIDWRKKYGWRKRGVMFIRQDIERTLSEMLEEAKL
jgi:hypothetical protein